jgi:hypothetical protein
MQKGLWVWWHPDGPTEWVLPSALMEPLKVNKCYASTTVYHGFVVEVERVDGQHLQIREGGRVLQFKALRCIWPNGYHHKEDKPVFTDQPHPGYQHQPAADERENGPGIQPPYGTKAEQDNQERWGPLREHDPNKHCKQCGKKGGCPHHPDKQVDDE